jgi:hypothetical protein
MGVAVPVTLFLLLDLHSLGGFITLAATTLFSWGVADLLASILERPRLSGRSPGRAIREHSSHLTGDGSAGSSKE